MFIFIFPGLLLFSWIGYQLYTAVADPAGVSISERANDGQSSSVNGMLSFHISLYEKEEDFDDLLEFTSSPDYSVNGIYFQLSPGLFPGQADKQSHRNSFKCFNSEYDFKPDKLLSKHRFNDDSGKIPDHYVFNIPIVFLSSQEYPPQPVA